MLFRSVLAMGMGISVGVFLVNFVSTREELTTQALSREADMLYASVENFMLVGEAPVAIKFLEDVRQVGGGIQIGLYRRNGQGAFSDDSTLEEVNLRLGTQRFKPKTSYPKAVREPERPYFDASSGLPPQTVFFRWKEGGRDFERLYRPLLNLPRCSSCHGADHTVRGVFDLRADITDFLGAQRAAVGLSLIGGCAMLAVLASLITRFIHAVVIDPILAVGRVCRAVNGGDFSGKVEIRRNDEMGRLAETVNEMVKGLYERFELTKYVSAGTLGALSGGQQPRRVERTLFFSDIRGFTAYTERHGAEAVISVLNRLLEEQARIIHRHGGDIDKFVGDEVVAVFSGDAAAARACLAALDVRSLAKRAEEFDGLALGIGIAGGTVIQGMVGSSLRADFTVIGEPVNVAARLCSLAKAGQVLVCDCTHHELEGSPSFVFSGPYSARLKGKADAQKVYVLASSSRGGPDA